MIDLDVFARALLVVDLSGRDGTCPACEGPGIHGSRPDLGYAFARGCPLDMALTSLGWPAGPLRDQARHAVNAGRPPWPTMELLDARRSIWEHLGDETRNPDLPEAARKLLREALDVLRDHSVG